MLFATKQFFSDDRLDEINAEEALIKGDGHHKKRPRKTTLCFGRLSQEKRPVVNQLNEEMINRLDLSYNPFEESHEDDS